MRPDLRESAGAAAERLSDALVASGFAGWDPYDALLSAALRAFARGRVGRLAAVQALKRSPVNVRPFLGVPKVRHTKALALCASAYGRLAAVTDEGRYEELSRALAGEVLARAIPAGAGAGWGYEFDVQTRWGFYRAGQPNAVVTVFAAHALLDVGQRSEAPDERLAAASSDALRYATSSLAVDAGRGERFFAYFEGSAVPVHNASLLVASLVARAGERDGPEWRAAEAAVAYSLARQRPDGSWPYGEAPGLEWVDGYHTAYVLEALARWHEATGDPAAEAAVRRGLDLYICRLVDPDGAPRATLDRRYPLDTHAAASAVGALCNLIRYDERAYDAAGRVLAWALATMTRRDGRFAFQRHRTYRNSISYIRWNDAHMLLALATYLTTEADGGA